VRQIARRDGGSREELRVHGKPGLHYWDAFWEFRVEDCPCDAHFIEWLDAEGVRDAAIYHFGTGGHHHVGIACADPGRRNAVLGITASPAEYEAYVQLTIAHPEILRHYNAVFGDIYLLNPKLLPTFDVVTLFHLCEFRSDKNDAYGALSDAEVLDILTARTRPGGHLLFYPGSFAFDRALPIIAAWAERQPVERRPDFKGLRSYRKL
jgi:hypothetical protein